MFYLIDKPTGISSHDVIYRMRRALGIKRTGHAGTLDPLATGLMVVAVGKDTKLLEYIVGMDKVYTCTFRLGSTSTTYDKDGEIVIQNTDFDISIQRLTQVLQEFTGDIYQVPPQYSAIKIQGRKAYDYAREGQHVNIPPRLISIYKLELMEYSAPDVTIRVHCSSGTYIRTLAHDIGQRLETGAYVTMLQRTAVGKATIDQATEIDQVTKDTPSIPFTTLYPKAQLYQFTPEQYSNIKMGRAIACEKNYQDPLVFGTIDNQIVTVMAYDGNESRLKPQKNLG